MKRFNVFSKKLGVVVTSSTLVALILAVTVLPISAPTQAASAPAVYLKFDMGTAFSPLASGYTRVTASTVYSGSLGYGWASTAALTHRSRSGPDALRRDLIFSSSDGTFKVDLVSGEYFVSVLIGDNDYPRDLIDVYAEGALKANDVSTAAGSFTNRTFTVACLMVSLI